MKGTFIMATLLSMLFVIIMGLAFWSRQVSPRLAGAVFIKQMPGVKLLACEVVDREIDCVTFDITYQSGEETCKATLLYLTDGQKWVLKKLEATNSKR